MISEKRPNKYDESIRTFALTLHSFSPRAYNYVREKFNSNLPATCTIKKWYANSSANGEPGISKESLETLTKLVEEKESTIYATLSFDEMFMKRHLQYSDAQKKFIGNITYGSIPSSAEYLPIANNAIVFMINGINITFNLPVAHHFINCLQSHEKAVLILMVLRAVSETGVKVVAIVFDGLFGNISTCNLLGASFDIDSDFKPFILNPIDNEKVFIMLDVPHMFKLARNCLGMKKTLYDIDGNLIEWKYFEALEELRSKYDVVTHKITKNHIMFEKNIMNVSLATQLLSESAAKSMEKFATIPETKCLFENSGCTSEFARRFNNIFDIFNSNHCNQNIFKSPINAKSKEQIFKYLDECVDYIKGLQIAKNDGSHQNILNSQKKTGFRGFIINIVNLKEIYDIYIDTKDRTSLSTRKLNQDPLENFFGLIRTTCLGNNNNPTVEQFRAAYRKIIVSTELTNSVFSNCVDSLNILQVSCSSKTAKVTTKPIIVRVEPSNGVEIDSGKTNDKAIESVRKALAPEQLPLENSISAFDVSDITISHLAGIIETKFISNARTNCTECVKLMANIFKENTKCDSLHVQLEISQIPCQSTIEICRIANKYLVNHAFKIDFDYNVLINDIEEDIGEMAMYTATDFTHDLQHKNDLLRFIIDEMIRIRATYIAKKITLNEQKKLLRRKNLKETHFHGQ